MLIKALESFHPLHVDLVWIIHPSKKGWINLRNERIDWAWMIAAGRWKNQGSNDWTKGNAVWEKLFSFRMVFSLVDSFSQNQKGLFIKYTWKPDSFDSVYVINNLFSPFFKIGENRGNPCLHLFFFRIFTTNPIFVKIVVKWSDSLYSFWLFHLFSRFLKRGLNWFITMLLPFTITAKKFSVF